MTLHVVVDSLGRALEFLGVLCAVVGIGQTWRRYRTEQEWLFAAPLRRAGWSVWARTAPILRWLTFGRFPKPVHHIAMAGTAVGGATVHAAGVVVSTSLPTDTSEALAELHARTMRLSLDVAKASGRVDSLERRLDARLQENDDALARERQERELEARQVAVDGLRLQGLGIGLVGLGGLLQLGSIFIPN